MTLKVVSDNTVELPVRNLMDISSMARGFADDLEKDAYGEVTRTLVIVDTVDGIRVLGWGEGVSQYEALGILEAAKMTSFASHFEED
jgi:hypothetical protein